jgi:hypothetical protein
MVKGECARLQLYVRVVVAQLLVHQPLDPAQPTIPLFAVAQAGSLALLSEKALVYVLIAC